MTEHPDELTGPELADGGPGVLRHLGGGEYELFDADGTKMSRCEPGDVLYVAPYQYVCRGGRWVREGIALD